MPPYMFEDIMKITEIKEFSKTKYEILTDSQQKLVLYKGDFRRMGLSLGAEISEKQLSVLLEELLPYRAKQRCMKLLEGCDYTEYELCKKLSKDGYPEAIIEDTLAYLKKLNYINDSRYIELYYRYKHTSKSRKQICMDLQNKGISKELIKEVFEDIFAEEVKSGDIRCIRKLLFKKKYEDSKATFADKEKVKMYLFRKGFDLQDIICCMKDFSCADM